MARLRVNLDIDSVIDVRYGWLLNQNPEMRDTILFSFNEYCNRDHDNFWLMFPEITEEQCRARKTYKLADLKAGVRTNIFLLIDDAIRSTVSNNGDDETEVSISVNFKHYELTATEIEQFLVIISARFEHRVKVVAIHRPFGKMNPRYLAENFDLNIYYDMVGWLKLYWSDLENNPQPRVVFYIPHLFPDKVEAERNFYRLMNQANLEGSHLETISDALAPYILIYFEGVKYFSPIASR